MRSVVDDLREEQLREQRAMSAAERVELALALGDDDLEVFRRGRGLSREEALAELRRLRQVGRTPCTLFEAEP